VLLFCHLFLVARRSGPFPCSFFFCSGAPRSVRTQDSCMGCCPVGFYAHQLFSPEFSISGSAHFVLLWFVRRRGSSVLCCRSRFCVWRVTLILGFGAAGVSCSRSCFGLQRFCIGARFCVVRHSSSDLVQLVSPASHHPSLLRAQFCVVRFDFPG
jgi:hypothetical protein